MAGRMNAGFDTGFLTDAAVALPVPATDDVRSDICPTADGATIRHCTHFSVSLSVSRRLCRWVAWNIDGARKVPATTRREFELDPMYPEAAQTGPALYAHNHLDQGHVAAYADVSWGPVAEAAQARVESCYYSNITPQLDSFNRSDLKGVWGQLENEIAKENKLDKQRLSEIGGPIFSPDDPAYEGAHVPREFWKVVAFVEDGTLKAKAFVLTQKDLEGNLALLALDQFRIYQHRIAELASKLGLALGPLVAADTAAQLTKEALAARPVVRRISSLREVNARGW